MSSLLFSQKIKRFWFPHLPNDWETSSQASLIFWTCLVSGCAVIPIILFAINSSREQLEPLFWILLGHSGVILSVFSLRFAKSMRVPSFLLGGIGTIQLIQAVYWSGGMQSNVLYSYPIFPVFLVYIGGIRLAAFCGAILTVSLFVFIFHSELVQQILNRNPYIDMAVLIWTLGSAMCIAVFVHVREKIARNLILIEVQKQENMQQDIQKLVEENSLFWSNISHELRNNITILYSFSELLKLDNPHPKQEKYIHHLLDTCGQIQSLLDQTMSLTQLNSRDFTLKEQECSLGGILYSIQQEFTVLANQNALDFVLDIDLESDIVYIDEHRLHQVLINLLSNAIKFTIKGKIILKVHSQKNQVVFSVIDTGIGIAKEEQTKIFEPYRRINKKGVSGMGLGLTIVKKILDQMNSKLCIESAPHEGTTCTFILKNYENKSGIGSIRA